MQVSARPELRLHDLLLNMLMRHMTGNQVRSMTGKHHAMYSCHPWTCQ